MRDAVEIEKEFILSALPWDLKEMNSKLMSEYIEYIGDRLLKQFGVEPIYNTKNPFGFMTMMSLEGKTNFFEKRVGEYSKSGVGKDQKEQTFGLDADF